MSNNPTPEDKELIKIIEKKVDRLYRAMFPDEFTISTKPFERPDNEVEYVECLDNENGCNFITIGKKYPLEKEEEHCYWVWNDQKELTFYLKKYFKKQSAQTTPVNGEWKKGDWVKKENGYIGIITDISHYTLEVDPQDGMNNEDYMGMAQAIKPTPEEIQSHLTRIAEKKGFKEGLHINQPWIKLRTNNSPIGSEPTRLISNEIFWVGNLCVWYKGQWAEIVSETTPKEVEQKERWQPKYGELYWYVDSSIKVGAITNVNDSVDKSIINSGNCFKTEEEADNLAELIRETLKQL